jgi:hypothetical protein
MSVPHRYRRTGRHCRKRALPELSSPCETGRTVPLPEFLIAIAIAAGVSLATFAHADRNGSPHATAWGVGAFLAAGVVVPIYVIRIWLRKRQQGA